MRNLQAFELIKPVNSLSIDLPPFPPKHQVNPKIAESGTGIGDIANPHPQQRLLIRLTFVSNRPPIDLNQPARAPLADLEAPLDFLCQLAPARRL